MKFLNELKKQKLTIGIIVSIIFLASIGFTYAYFTAGILEQNVHDEIVTTGSLKLLYVDGPYIEANNFYPGMAVEKEFVVSNIGTYDAEYSINWKSLVNGIENDELVISLTCKRYTDYLGEKNEVGSCENLLPQVVGNNKDVPIKGNIPVEVGITHEYTLRIELLEISADQNYNQGKTFAGEVMIDEYKIDETNVPLIESASINNLNLSARVTDNIGVVAYTIVKPGETPTEWEPVSSDKNLELEEDVDDYDRILWVKNQTGTVVYRDLTPEGTVIVDPAGGIFPDEEVANASIYNIKRMSTKSGAGKRSIAGPLTYVLKYKQTLDLKDPVKEGHTFTGWNVDGTLSRVNGKRFVMGIENTNVTASWNTVPYTLTVNPNGGTWESSTNSQEFTINYGSTKEISNPTRKGYTFTGWTLTDGTNSTLESTTFIMGSDDCEIIATWTVNSYPWIAYHNKQNINDTNYTLVGADTASGSAVYNTQVTPPVKNYVGFTSPATQTITIDEDAAIPTKNKVNYNYNRNSYNVSYILDGGEASGNPNTLKYDQTSSLTSPEKSGHDFSYWTAVGSGTTIDGTTMTMGSEDATLTAHYDAQSYTLSFNGNGGSSPANQSITYGNTYGTLPTSTRTGYTFAGWFTSAAGGSQITASSTVAVTSNQTLYAHWTANTYTVNLTKGTGVSSIVATGCVEVTAGSKYTCTYGTSVTVTGTASAGYTMSTTLTGTNITNKTNAVAFTMPVPTSGTEVTLAASATVNTYTLNLTKGTGVSSVVATGCTAVTAGSKYTCTYGASVTVTGTAAAGYTMSTTLTGTNIANKTNAAAFTMPVPTSGTAVTLAAAATANKYTVTLNNQSATSAGTASVSATYNAAMPGITKPARAYKVTYNGNGGSTPAATTATYTFGGYYTATNGGGTQYYTAAGASARAFNLTAATTLYAKWTATAVTLPSISRSGFIFNGWYTAASGGSRVGGAGNSYTPTAAITLYAQWTQNTVYYCAGDGYEGTSSSSMNDACTQLCWSRYNGYCNVVLRGTTCTMSYYYSPYTTTYNACGTR